jgi:hypothetical protein
MRIGRWFAVACGAALIAGASAAAAQAGTSSASSNLDGLVEVKSKRFDQMYLRPGADFRNYRKVILSTTQVTFAENWIKEMNAGRIALLQGTTAADAERIAEDARASLRDVFSSAFRGAGYAIVATPGADVLGFALSVIDVYINAPATVTQALPSRVYTYDAGEATLVLDVRDSATGLLLGHVVDRRTAGNRGNAPSSLRITNSVSNRFDFEVLFNAWARDCIDELKAQSPVTKGLPTQGNR